MKLAAINQLLELRGATQSIIGIVFEHQPVIE